MSTLDPGHDEHVGSKFAEPQRLGAVVDSVSRAPGRFVLMAKLSVGPLGGVIVSSIELPAFLFGTDVTPGRKYELTITPTY